MQPKRYKELIFTNHAWERLGQRGISESEAYAAWRNPDYHRKGKSPGSTVFYRAWGKWMIEVVCKQNERKEWIVLSVWTREAHRARHYAKPQRDNWLIALLKKIFLPR